MRAISQNGSVWIRLEDTDTNPLSDSENMNERQNFEDPELYSDTGGAGFVALESGAGGVFGPAGGAYNLYLFNPTAATIELSTLVINLIGVKRYPESVCL